jgi:hypothetical protein
MNPSASSPRAATRNRTWTDEALQRAARALGAGGAYFLAIALASWSFDPLREILVRRGAPRLWATLLEAPAMLLLLAIAAAAAIRAFRVHDRVGDRLLVGGFGVTLLVAAELIGGPLVRSWGLYETLTLFMPEPSGLFLVLLIGAVFTPLVEPVGYSSGPDGGAPFS